MFPGGGCSADDLGVEDRRRADDHRVDVRALQQVAPVGVGMPVAVQADEQLAVLAAGISHRDELDLVGKRIGNRAQHRGMRAADEPGTDESNANAIHGRASLPRHPCISYPRPSGRHGERSSPPVLLARHAAPAAAHGDLKVAATGLIDLTDRCPPRLTATSPSMFASMASPSTLSTPANQRSPTAVDGAVRTAIPPTRRTSRCSGTTPRATHRGPARGAQRAGTREGAPVRCAR